MECNLWITCAGSLKFGSKVVLWCECIPPLCPMCKIDNKGIVQSLAAVACMRDWWWPNFHWMVVLWYLSWQFVNWMKHSERPGKGFPMWENHVWGEHMNEDGQGGCRCKIVLYVQERMGVDTVCSIGCSWIDSPATRTMARPTSWWPLLGIHLVGSARCGRAPATPPLLFLQSTF